MSVRRAIGLILALIGGWLFWGGVSAVNILVNRGSSLSDALMQPPTSLLRLLATGLVLIGGLAVLAGKGMGRWIALIGILLFSLLGGLMILAGADSVMWADEAVISGVLWALFLGLVITNRS